MEIKKFDNFEDHDNENYMFFANLENIIRMSEEILKMDEKEIDLLLSEHDWASDHISKSKENIIQVYNFLHSTYEKK